MGSRRADGFLHGLSRLAESQAAQLTDGQLLDRFAVHRDEAAFAALLQRHGGLVYAVCRNILRHEHDAEDAFQGTFLVLARKAGAIRSERAVGSWLYRVAYRVATKARRSAERRRRREEETARPDQDRPAGELAWRELQAMLDEELNRLPEKYRAPFVLCCLTGKSKSEAAAELGWKEGTVSSRLAHARSLLQARLARRGVVLSAVLSGLAITTNGAAATVPAGLLAATRAAAVAFAAGEPLASAPAALARAVLWRTTAHRLKLAAAVVALAGLVGGAAVALHRPPVPPEQPSPPPPAPEVAVAPAPRPAPAPQGPAPGKTMTVGGLVVGPDARPIPGARVLVTAAANRRPGEPNPPRFAMRVLGEGRADDRGLFRVPAEQTTADHYRLTAVAVAPGYAPSGRLAEPNTITAAEHNLTIQLVRGRTVRARLLDPDGRPAAGVRLDLLGLYRNPNPGGILVLYDELPDPATGWPGPVTTDESGSFTLDDIAPGTRVSLLARDDRFAPQWVEFDTGPKELVTGVSLTLAPPRTLDGLVTAEDTGEPLAGARVVVETEPTARGGLRGYAEGHTDAAGRFRVRPFPGPSLRVWVSPPPGRPYLELEQRLKWPAGAVAHQLALSPLRGVLVRGTVTEAGSGRPVAGAVVKYEHRTEGSPLQEKEPELLKAGLRWHVRDARTGPDGTFSLAVPPGSGSLLVKAAGPDYLHAETSFGWLELGTAGGTPMFPDALVPLSLPPSDRVHETAAVLRRGVTVRGRVVGHDGRPTASAVLFCPGYLPQGLEVRGDPVLVRDGRFELPGCQPGGKVQVWVYDPRAREGAVAEFTAGADEPEVRLAPCASARVRVVDKAGKPVAVTHWSPFLVLRPGDDVNESLWRQTRAGLDVPAVRVHGRDYAPTPAGGAAVLFPDLIPGATYSLTVRVGQGLPSRVATFTAPRAGSRDLGDVTYASDLDPPAPRK